MAERTTRVIPVDPLRPEGAGIDEAAALLRAGDVVAFPTETVYGLGGSALDAGAIARIYEAKGRPRANPLIVHVLDEAGAERVAARLPESAALLAARFWPGPLTLVLPRRADVPDVVSAGRPTVAVRAPAHPVARALIAAADLPVAAPSANRSNTLSPTTAAHVVASLGGRIPLVLDGGACAVGLESTVLDLSGEQPRVLRPGSISARALSSVLGQPVLAGRVLVGEHDARDAPGTSRRHYAPRARLEIVPRGWLAWRARFLTEHGVTFRVVCRAPAPPELDAVALPADAAGFGHVLYAALHDADASGVARIVVEAPPRDDEAWTAIDDRLRRAAT